MDPQLLSRLSLHHMLSLPSPHNLPLFPVIFTATVLDIWNIPALILSSSKKKKKHIQCSRSRAHPLLSHYLGISQCFFYFFSSKVSGFTKSGTAEAGSAESAVVLLQTEPRTSTTKSSQGPAWREVCGIFYFFCRWIKRDSDLDCDVSERGRVCGDGSLWISGKEAGEAAAGGRETGWDSTDGQTSPAQSFADSGG